MLKKATPLPRASLQAPPSLIPKPSRALALPSAANVPSWTAGTASTTSKSRSLRSAKEAVKLGAIYISDRAANGSAVKAQAKRQKSRFTVVESLQERFQWYVVPEGTVSTSILDAFYYDATCISMKALEVWLEDKAAVGPALTRYPVRCDEYERLYGLPLEVAQSNHRHNPHFLDGRTFVMVDDDARALKGYVENAGGKVVERPTSPSAIHVYVEGGREARSMTKKQLVDILFQQSVDSLIQLENSFDQ